VDQEDAQFVLDYQNDAQQRVAADTLALMRFATLTTLPSGVADLPSDLVRLVEVSIDGGTVTRYDRVDEFLDVAAGHTTAVWPRYAVVGHLLYLHPAGVQSVHVTYYARPQPARSSVELEVAGEYDDLVKRLMDASKTLDRCEPEMSMYLLSEYDADAARLRAVSQGAGTSGSTRIRLGRRG
jgi:hypothetical protein